MSLQYCHKDVLEQFEATEGIYKLKSVLNPKGIPVAPPANRLPSVRLSFCDSRSACCINSGRDIYIYPTSGCQLYESYAPPGKRSFKTSFPVCHDFSVSSLLLVGLTAGEINMIDPFHKEFCKVFNEEKHIERSAVTCIRWVPYSTNHFLVAHASGHMYLYNEELPCCNSPPVYQQFKRGSSFIVYTCRTKSTCNPLYNWALTGIVTSPTSDTIKSFQNNPLQVRPSGDTDVSLALLSAINQFSFSTCGKHLAVVTEDGYMRVFDYHRMELYGFMRSYFGGLTCVDWSPDGKFVVVGGQDDLITIWSFTAQAVICRGQGHKSWTNVVRFDPFVFPASASNVVTSNETREHEANSLRSTNKIVSCPSLSLRPNGSINGSIPDEESSTFRTYRLGSVGQDTFLCLWELTEDVIRHGMRFSSQATTSSTAITTDNGLGSSDRDAKISSKTLSLDGSRRLPGVNSSNTMPRGVSKRKTINFFLRLPASKASELTTDTSSSGGGSSKLADSAKLSVLSDSGLSSDENGLVYSIEAVNTQLSFLSSRDLLGTPNCPRLSDVPILEPFAKFGIARDLITDMVFREDSINLAFQQGIILTFSRPMDSQISDVCGSTYEASNPVEENGDEDDGVDDEDVENVVDEEEEEGLEVSEYPCFSPSLHRSSLISSVPLPVGNRLSNPPEEYTPPLLHLQSPSSIINPPYLPSLAPKALNFRTNNQYTFPNGIFADLQDSYR